MADVLLVVAGKDFQDKEFADTRSVLEGAGHVCVVASTAVGVCRGAFGSVVDASLSLADVRESSFDAVVFIGGSGAHALKDDPAALRLAKAFFDAHKVVGAICISPVILAVAGVLRGKRATVWNGDGKQSKFLEQHGAEYSGESVTVDGLVVTADGPPSAKEFGRALVRLLA